MRSFAKASNKIPRVFIYLLFTLGFFYFSWGYDREPTYIGFLEVVGNYFLGFST